MTQITLSLYRLTLRAGETAQIPGTGTAAVLAHDHRLMIADKMLETGNGTIAQGGASVSSIGDDVATALVFVLAKGPGAVGALASEMIKVQFPCLMRLDEVAFPPGAQAYRHVHAGHGFRHIRWGQLHLEADDHAFVASAGDTWFEAANSPVRATASTTEPETRFVRCMILPLEFEGKPTIRILDPTDAGRPKKQVTHRHVDHRLDALPQFDAG